MSFCGFESECCCWFKGKSTAVLPLFWTTFGVSGEFVSLFLLLLLWLLLLNFEFVVCSL